MPGILRRRSWRRRRRIGVNGLISLRFGESVSRRFCVGILSVFLAVIGRVDVARGGEWYRMLCGAQRRCEVPARGPGRGSGGWAGRGRAGG